VKCGSEGGKKGGKARADALTDDERAAIARRAARARWSEGTEPSLPTCSETDRIKQIEEN